MRQHDPRPWWLDLVINVAPLAVLMIWQEWDCIGPWLDSLRDKLIPAVAVVDVDRLEFLRARYEAGGWAGAADRAAASAEERGREGETHGGDSAGADHAD